jgi:hypothetical protein
MANVTVTLTGDEQKLLRSLDKIIQKERETAAAATQAGDESARASRKAEHGLKGLADANEGVFGKRGLDFVGGYISKIGSIAGAVALAKAALADLNKSIEESAAKGRSAEFGFAGLALTAGGDVGMLKKLTADSWDLYRKGGAKSADDAAEIVNRLQSIGENDDVTRNLYASLYGPFKDTVGVAKAASGLKFTMGVDETGSTADILSKTLGAAGKSPDKAEGLLMAAAKSGASMKAIGGSDEELLAGVAFLSKAFSTEEAGTHLSGLIDLIDKKGMGGQGFLPGLQLLQKKLGEGTSLTDSEILKTLVEQTDVKGRQRVDEKIKLHRQKLMTDSEIVATMSQSDEFGGRIQALQNYRKPIDMQEFFGETTSLKAYRNLITKIPEMQSLIQEQKNAEQEGKIWNVLKSTEGIQEIRIPREARENAATLEHKKHNFGLQRIATDAAMDNMEGRLLGANGGLIKSERADQISAWMARKGAEAFRWAAGDDYAMELIGTPRERRRYKEDFPENNKGENNKGEDMNSFKEAVKNAVKEGIVEGFMIRPKTVQEATLRREAGSDF